MATIQDYKDIMPTVFQIKPDMTKTGIEAKLSAIPAPPAAPIPPTPTGTNVVNLFNDLYTNHSNVEAAIAALGGLLAVSNKHNMTIHTCRQIISEFEAARELYNQ